MVKFMNIKLFIVLSHLFNDYRIYTDIPYFTLNWEMWLSLLFSFLKKWINFSQRNRVWSYWFSLLFSYFQFWLILITFSAPASSRRSLVIDLRHFLISNVSMYYYQFSSEHCFGCIPHILICCILSLFSSMYSF